MYAVQLEGNSNAMVENSIFFTGSVLFSPQHNQPLSHLIRDDDVALEETEFITLQLVADSECPVNVFPFNTTTIKVHDDDSKLIYSMCCMIIFCEFMAANFLRNKY